MVSWRLKFEVHGSDGFTSVSRLVLAAGLVGAVVLAVQLSFSSWYTGRLLPGTVVGDQNLSGLTLPQARLAIAKMSAAERIQLAIAGQNFDFSPAQLGVSYDTDATLAAAYQAGRSEWWRLPTPTTQPLVYHLDTPKLGAALDVLAAGVGVAPVDAQIQVRNGQLQTIPESSGRTIDRLKLARLIEQSLAQGQATKLAVAPRVQLADIKAASLGPTLTTARQIMATPVTLSYQGRTWNPSAAQVGAWLTFSKTDGSAGPQLVPEVDQSKLKSYVQTIANSVDVPAVNQLVTVQNGATTVNQVGVAGTAIDQDAVVAAVAAAVMSSQALVYGITDHTVPFRTITTNFTVLGYPKYIEINLSKQHAWVWQDGQIIYDTPVTSGATGAGFPTVTGLFSIYYKTTNTHLVGYQYGPRYNYDVTVKYWMPFYSGYGLHDASWRNGNFGGSDYYYGGSHGCVNLPDAAAEFIYNWSDVGTPVWVHK